MLRPVNIATWPTDDRRQTVSRWGGSTSAQRCECGARREIRVRKIQRATRAVRSVQQAEDNLHMNVRILVNMAGGVVRKGLMYWIH